MDMCVTPIYYSPHTAPLNLSNHNSSLYGIPVHTKSHFSALINIFVGATHDHVEILLVDNDY